MSSKRNVKYKCPFCEKRLNRQQLINHISDKHMDVLPEDFTPLRYTFNYVNRKPIEYHGKCTECGSPTPWDENKARYNRQCGKETCYKSFISKFESNMLKTHGVTRISATADGLEKMLANRKISGKYKMQDGSIKTFTGSYEKKAIEFMDKVMNLSSKDILCPGPILEYQFEGKTHIYITDFYYQPYNLIIEVKDGGDSPNRRPMAEYRAKQIAKEEYIIKETNYNYLRLTNNNLSQLLSVFMDIKMQLVDNSKERVIHVNESEQTNEVSNALMSLPPIGMNSGPDSVYVVNYMQNNAFTGEDINGYGLVDSPKLEKIITRDKIGKLKETSGIKFLSNCNEYFLYKVSGITEEQKRIIKDNVNEFVEEGFLYETLFNKKLYTLDQINCENNVERITDFYTHMSECNAIIDRLIHNNGGYLNE